MSNEIRARGAEDEKAMLEVLADEVYGSSQSSVVRTLVRETFHAHFGDVDPDALLTRAVDPDALLDGDLSADDLDADHRLDSETEAETTAVASDGGAVRSPESYQATLSPTELARSGPELSWDELSEVVADPEDGGRWSDTLKIHPDRVPEDGLKQNRRVTTRILTGICRSESLSGILKQNSTKDTGLNGILETYVAGMHNRLDSTAGKNYFVETYRDLLEENYLYPIPKTEKDAYYVSEARAQEGLQTIIEDSVTEIEAEFDDTFDRDRWNATHEVERGRDARRAWQNAVADYLREVIAPLRVIHQGRLAEVADGLGVTPDDYRHVSLYLAQTVEDALDRYQKMVPADDRRVIEEQLLDDDLVDTLSL